MDNDSKTYVKGFRFRIYPTVVQKQYFSQIFGCCRYVYNRLLAESQTDLLLHKQTPEIHSKPNVSGIGMSYKLPIWKREKTTDWLNLPPSQVLQQSCHHLSNAYQRFFKEKKNFPRFKSKHGAQSCTFTNQTYRIENDSLWLAKCSGLVKVRWSRKLPNLKRGNCVITRTTTGKYYASFQCEYFPEQTSGQGFLGIDAGITDLATMSDGKTLQNPRHYVKAQHRLKILQRRLSRKQKGSKNRAKARLKVARLHEYVSAQRHDTLHKFTTAIIRENQAIAIERLFVKNMVKNRHLAKHILDAGWGIMREQLKYKAIASQHCLLVLADPYYPSTQLCSECGQKPLDKIKLGVVQWTCSYCNTTHGRDLNAAKNLEILAHIHRFQHDKDKSAIFVRLADRYIPFILKD